MAETGFNCKKFHHRCKAVCCGIFPLSKSLYEKNKEKIVREIVDSHEFIGMDLPKENEIPMILPITKDSTCPFLKEDLACNIYDERPLICRVYGTAKIEKLMCPYQDEKGIPRSRQQQRKIFRWIEKSMVKLCKKRKMSAEHNSEEQDGKE